MYELAICALLLFCIHPLNGGPQDAATTTHLPVGPFYKIACGFDENQDQCIAHGCEFKFGPSLPFCFYLTQRVNCYTEKIEAPEQACLDRGCVWAKSTIPNLPWCYYHLPTSAPPTVASTSTVPTVQTTSSEPLTTSSPEVQTTPEPSTSTPFQTTETPSEPTTEPTSTIASTTEIPTTETEPSTEVPPTTSNEPTTQPTTSPVTVSPPSILIDCHPDRNPDANDCAARGCLWIGDIGKGKPSCVFSNSLDNFAGYNATSVSQSSSQLNATLIRRDTPFLFGREFAQVEVSGRLTTNALINFVPVQTRPTSHPSESINRFIDATERISGNSGSGANTLLEIEVKNAPFGIKVIRRSTKTAIFDTTELPGLTFASQYQQLSSRLPSRNIYGLGQIIHMSFRHDINWRNFTLFNRDASPFPGTMPDMNSYGYHPFYLCMENDGNAHGVLLLSRTPLNVAFQPDPDIVTLRSIEVSSLGMVFFPGPTPLDVIQQFSEVTGRPVLPPYWGLGFHISRRGFQSLDEVIAVNDRNRNAKIPFDAMYIDVNYMDNDRDFTYDHLKFAGLPEFADNLHQNDSHLVLITDSGISSRVDQSYTAWADGIKMDIFIKNATGFLLKGRSIPGDVYFPDFSSSNISKYWQELHQQFHDEVKFDGISYDLNEPSDMDDGSTNGCAKNTWNNPPYNPLLYNQELFTQTLCMDALQEFGIHYELHTPYGLFESEQSSFALQLLTPNKRPFVLTRSTAPGSGSYAAHWTGNVYSDFSELRRSIISMLEMNMFGIPWVGTDICGFHQNATEELCIRWMQLGTFYPFARNHNNEGNRDQDPAVWSQEAVDIMRSAVYLRYVLLPLYYSEMVQSHQLGLPAVRPLFFEFPKDPNGYFIDDQFMWGSRLMAAPVLEQGATSRNVYFPAGRWFNIFPPFEEMTPGIKQVSMPINETGAFVRGGSIVPLQGVGQTVVESRSKPLGIFVALDDDFEAAGSMFWDDGESTDSYSTGQYMEFSFKAASSCSRADGYILINTLTNKFTGKLPPNLDSVVLVGLEYTPAKFFVNRQEIPAAKVVNLGNGKVSLKELDLSISILSQISITFES